MATWPLIGGHIFDFSSETSELNSTKLDRKQDLIVLYQVCVFQADRKNKMAALANPSKKGAHCTQVLDMWPFGPLVSKFVVFWMTSKSQQFVRFASLLLIATSDDILVIHKLWHTDVPMILKMRPTVGHQSHVQIGIFYMPQSILDKRTLFLSFQE